MRKQFTNGSKRCGLLALLCFGIAVPLQAQQDQSSRTESVELDVLMRGPVHEGFAEPATGSDSQATSETRGTLRLPEPIPDPIDEQPARIRPSDNQRQAVWLPGYWGVEDQENLCWVSGTWRYSPPGMQWVPGYWTSQRGDSVWVPGFWAKESSERLTYLPAPPQPPADAIEYRQPRDGRFWVPGCYVWQDNRYRWQEGFWADAQQNWVWVPQRLVRTPRGYLQAPGYWDYPIDRRGTLFAPVRYSNRLIGRRYRPSVAVNVATALASWFVRPNYGHYYFGSYYGNRYNDFGLVPWGPYAGRNAATYYDPLYAYYATTRTGYLQDLVRTHQSLINNGSANLPITFADYQRDFRGGVQSPLGNLARSVDQLVSDGKTEGFDSFEELTLIEGGDVAQQIESQVQQLRQFAQGRRQAEVSTEANVRRESGQQRGDERREGRRGDEQMSLRDRVEDRVDRVEESAAEAAEQARDRAAEAAEQAEERVRDSVESVRKDAEEAAERAAEATEGLRNRAEEAAEQARERAGQLRDRVRDEAVQGRRPEQNVFDLSPYRQRRRQPQSRPSQPVGDAQDAPQRFSPPAGLQGRVRGGGEARGRSGAAPAAGGAGAGASAEAAAEAGANAAEAAGAVGDAVDR